MLTLSCVTGVDAQHGILIPEIINFSKKTYGSGNQNRGIGQDKRGLLYFANDDGLLVYDGSYWKTYPLPNSCIVRSLIVAGDRIYIGGQQEIGYFFFDQRGVLVYQSLKQLIPPGETEFSDVWRVVRFGKELFFQSNKRIFWYHDGRITAFKSINWGFLGESRGLLLGQNYEKGLLFFKDGQWLPFNSKYDFSKDQIAIRSITDFGGNGSLLTTLKSGVYVIGGKEGNGENEVDRRGKGGDKGDNRRNEVDKGAVIDKFETPAVAAIVREIILSSCAIDTSLIVFATRLGGYYVINTRGEIVQHITKKEGLQSNTVNTVYADKEKNIWLGLNNGIDLVIYNSPINHIVPDPDNKSPGYSAAIYNNQLYIGTGIGLYSIPVQSNNNTDGIQGTFSLVKNSNGLVWGLSVVNDQLLMGRNDGAYRIDDGKCIAIDSSTGFWSFQPLTVRQPCQRIIAGTYNGINIYDFDSGRFVNPKVHTFFESAKYCVVAGNDIWVAHPYQGLYKIYFNEAGVPASKPYKDVHNILSSGHNHLFKIRDRIVLTTRKGIFEYDKTIDDFSESGFFKKLFGRAFISYLREDTQGNIWFIEDKMPGVVDFSAPEKPAIIYFPELNNNVLGNDEEFIYPINKNNILIAGETGFFHINYEKYRAAENGLRVLLRTVTAFHNRDSILFGGYLAGKDLRDRGDIYDCKDKVGYQWNSIHFEFSAPTFEGVVVYSSRLKGYEKEWSVWTKRTERSYTNLPAGKYVFEVRGKNTMGHESAVSQYVFSISPPWYKTYLAYFIYVLLIMAIIYLSYKRQQKKYLIQHKKKLIKQREKFEEEQKRLQYLHQLEIEKSEKEIIRLKNIKLETEVEHSNAALASNTMNLVQKKELLNKIKDEIFKVQEEPESEKKTKNIRRIIKIINEQLEISDDWERFSLYFDKVNNDFLAILKENYLLLTPTDLKLCAYLRLNLSTKAIADLLNLSIRGVESSRYRLRKKLGLPNEVTLFDFLGGIGGGGQRAERSINGEERPGEDEKRVENMPNGE